jgi:glycosyltransferase involved in cell wall biosynthesis
MDSPKILVIIPAFNEQASIEKTIKDVLIHKQQYPNLHICVINDGSVDETASIVKRMGVTLIDLPFNLGIGGAVQTGYKYGALHNYDLAIQFDADGQHKGEELHKIIQPVLDGECDMAIGSRFLQKTSYKGTIQRRIGIYFFEKLLHLLTKTKITDPTSGFRCINRKILSLFATNYPKDYPEPEVIVMLRKKGFTIKEVSVEMNERNEGQSSITPFRSIYYMFKVSLSILVQRAGKGTNP